MTSSLAVTKLRVPLTRCEIRTRLDGPYFFLIIIGEQKNVFSIKRSKYLPGQYLNLMTIGADRESFLCEGTVAKYVSFFSDT